MMGQNNFFLEMGCGFQLFVGAFLRIILCELSWNTKRHFYLKWALVVSCSNNLYTSVPAREKPTMSECQFLE